MIPNVKNKEATQKKQKKKKEEEEEEKGPGTNIQKENKKVKIKCENKATVCVNKELQNARPPLNIAMQNQH